MKSAKFKVQSSKLQKGFTLVEMLIVISIVGVVMGLGFATLSSTLRSSTKATVFNQVKQNGDLVMETMTRSIRSAIDVCVSGKDISIYTSQVDCASPPSAPRTLFRCTEGVASGTPEEKNGKIEKFEIVSAGGAPASQLTITSKVKVSSCIFNGPQATPATGNSQKYVSISFTLSQDAGLSTGVDTTVSIPFRSEVNLRNFK